MNIARPFCEFVSGKFLVHGKRLDGTQYQTLNHSILFSSPIVYNAVLIVHIVVSNCSP